MKKQTKFVLEFKEEKKYLIIINGIVQNIRKDKLIDLDNVYQDIELTKEKNTENESYKNKNLMNDYTKMIEQNKKTQTK